MFTASVDLGFADLSKCLCGYKKSNTTFYCMSMSNYWLYKYEL